MAHRPGIAVIADDLTGAADTGVQFCPAVGPVLLATAGDRLPRDTRELPAGLAISTNSRHQQSRSAGLAVQRCVNSIKVLAPALIYKKIDSCLRGNLGSELDALLEATGAVATFVAPAYPAQGRTTVNDLHLLHGVPVADTEIAQDPLCPIGESRLSVLLAGQSHFTIGRIDLDQLNAPVDGLAAKVQSLIDHGCRHLVFDAETTDHLDIIAGLVRGLSPGILPVGSAGLAASLARILAGEQPSTPCMNRPVVTRWLFVCGSASPMLARQAKGLATATGWQMLTLSPAELVAGVGTLPMDRAQDLILTVAAPADSGPSEDPEGIVRGLAKCAADLLPVLRPDGLFLSGGDTAEAFRRQVGADALLLHEETLPGLVRSELVGGRQSGLAIFTKAGSFGEEDTLVQLVNHRAP